MLKILVVLLILLLLTVILVVFGQRRLIYPVRNVNQNVLEASPRRQLLHRKFKDFSVEAWLLLPEGTPKGLVVHAHGNGEYLDVIEEAFIAYTTDNGYAVLMPEYRGYSRSGGSPSKEAILNDFEYFLDQVTEVHPHLKERIVYHGRSLGGGVVGELARTRPPHGLIIESTFTSIGDVAKERFFVPHAWVWDNYNIIDFLKTFEGPVLILHGHQDEVISFAYAQRNFAAAKNAKLVDFEGGHNDTMSLNWAAYREAINEFLNALP